MVCVPIEIIGRLISRGSPSIRSINLSRLSEFLSIPNFRKEGLLNEKKSEGSFSPKRVRISSRENGSLKKSLS